MANELIYSNKCEVGLPIAINSIIGMYKTDVTISDTQTVYRICFIVPGGQIQYWQYVNKVDRDTSYNKIVLNYGWLAD